MLIKRSSDVGFFSRYILSIIWSSGSKIHDYVDTSTCVPASMSVTSFFFNFCSQTTGLENTFRSSLDTKNYIHDAFSFRLQGFKKYYYQLCFAYWISRTLCLTFRLLAYRVTQSFGIELAGSICTAKLYSTQFTMLTFHFQCHI